MTSSYTNMHYLYCTFIEFKTKIKIEIGGDNNENI